MRMRQTRGAALLRGSRRQRQDQKQNRPQYLLHGALVAKFCSGVKFWPCLGTIWNGHSSGPGTVRKDRGESQSRLDSQRNRARWTVRRQHEHCRVQAKKQSQARTVTAIQAADLGCHETKRKRQVGNGCVMTIHAALVVGGCRNRIRWSPIRWSVHAGMHHGCDIPQRAPLAPQTASPPRPAGQRLWRAAATSRPCAGFRASRSTSR